MSNMCNTYATKMKNVASAKYLPGHMLMTAEFSPRIPTYIRDSVPTPKSEDHPCGIDRVLPSFRNRSGRNLSGSGYRSGSCVIALSTVLIKGPFGDPRKNERTTS